MPVSFARARPQISAAFSRLRALPALASGGGRDVFQRGRGADWRFSVGGGGRFNVFFCSRSRCGALAKPTESDGRGGGCRRSAGPTASARPTPPTRPVRRVGDPHQGQFRQNPALGAITAGGRASDRGFAWPPARSAGPAACRPRPPLAVGRAAKGTPRLGSRRRRAGSRGSSRRAVRAVAPRRRLR